MASQPTLTSLLGPESPLDFSRLLGGSALQSDLLAFGSSNAPATAPYGRSAANPVDEAEGPVGILNMKTQWIKNQLKAREKEFTEKMNITYERVSLLDGVDRWLMAFVVDRVFCGTWNVNGKRPTESLTPWFRFDGPPADIYAIGYAIRDPLPLILAHYQCH